VHVAREFCSERPANAGLDRFHPIKKAKIRKFALLIPATPVFEAETGSYLTAHTTIQSSRTVETVVDRKEAVSAGILPPIFKVPGLCRE
jgi:hypothetical protein